MKISGQFINIQNSSILFGKKISVLRKQQILKETGFQMKSLSIKYLGAPLFIGRKKTISFQEILEKIQSRISGWEKKFLNFGGKLILNKSVLASMLLHILKIIGTPKCIFQKMRKMFNRIFWGSTEEVKKMHWNSWIDNYYRIEEGGLGVRSLEDVSKAFELQSILLKLFGRVIYRHSQSLRSFCF